MARATLIATTVCLLLMSAMIPLAWSQPTDSGSQGGSGLLFSVSVDKRVYLSGEAIGIRLVLINPTLSELDLGYVSASSIDYEILSNGVVVYRWSDHWIFIAIVWKLTMAPLEVKEFNFVHTDADYSLSLGVYQVRGIFVNHAEAYASFVVADVLPAVALRFFSITLGAGLAAIVVLLTGQILAWRPASKPSRRFSS